MQIDHQTTAHGGRFSAHDGQTALGHLDYHRSGAVMDAHHTFVDPEARGRGVAEALLNALAAYAQAEHAAIRPSCSYVAKKLPQLYPQLLAAE